MQAAERSRALQRRSRYETYEERLALSAQPISDFQLDLNLEQRVEHHAGEVTQLGATEHATTGVSYVRDAFGFGGSGQTVAIIDSGIAYDHVALGGGLGSSYQVVGGWDFAENDADIYDDGPSGFHGTHVAGIVGANHDQYGGVAPDVDLVGLRVFDDAGNGYFSWVESALQWVHDNRNSFENPITTVNLSLGTNWNADSIPNWATLEDEFAQLEADGIFIAVSAGNSFDTYGTAGLSYPAASSFVVPVASVDADGQLSDFSQRNSRVIAAPGGSIASTVPDHVFGADGDPNDFAISSGTSMASPYVAGASTLVRQAMEFVGGSNITQDAIYDHLRSTADVIYDAVTNANYYSLNVQAAIDALMPDDDFGSTANAAHSLGSLADGLSFSGLVGRLSDADFFSFTAEQAGTASFQFDVSHELVLDAQLVGDNATLDNGSLTFDVLAGQTYTIGLSTNDGLGYYDATVQFDAAATDPTIVDLGSIDLRSLTDQEIDGENWYQVTATRAGTFTVEALFEQADGNVDMEVYSVRQQLLGAAAVNSTGERLDLDVAQGEQLLVRIVGHNADVDLRMTNLISVDAGTVTVFGTDQDDQYQLAVDGAIQLVVDEVSYDFGADEVTHVEFHGGGGTDTVDVAGNVAQLDVQYNDVNVVGSQGDGGSSSNNGGGSGDEQAATDDLARRAYEVDQAHGLTFAGRYYENWAGQGEKWMQGDGGWYFITPDGNLYRWNGTSDVLSSEQIASLDSSFHADPTKLHDAPEPADDDGNQGASGDQGDTGDQNNAAAGEEQSGDQSRDDLAWRAYETDQQLGLRSSGNYHENWLGHGEKWLRGNDGWYFLTTDGELYRWTGGSDLSSSELVATFDSSFHADPTKLHDAQRPADTGGSSSNDGRQGSDNTSGTGNDSTADSARELASRARQLDQQLGLRFGGSYHHNWGGQGEKWMRGDAGWYFITPDGNLYAWNGSTTDITGSQLVASLDASFHTDPSKLHDAPATASTSGLTQVRAVDDNSADAAAQDATNVDASAGYSATVARGESQTSANGVQRTSVTATDTTADATHYTSRGATESAVQSALAARLAVSRDGDADEELGDIHLNDGEIESALQAVDAVLIELGKA